MRQGFKHKDPNASKLCDFPHSKLDPGVEQVYNGWQPCPGPVGTTPEPTAEIEDGSLDLSRGIHRSLFQEDIRNIGVTWCTHIPSEDFFLLTSAIKFSSGTLTIYLMACGC